MHRSKTVSLLDHLVGTGEQRRRHSQPIALAVLRLKTSLNLVGICTGRSPGFSPRRIRSTYSAVLRKLSSKS